MAFFFTAAKCWVSGICASLTKWREQKQEQGKCQGFRRRRESRGRTRRRRRRGVYSKIKECSRAVVLTLCTKSINIHFLKCHQHLNTTAQVPTVQLRPVCEVEDLQKAWLLNLYRCCYYWCYIRNALKNEISFFFFFFLLQAIGRAKTDWFLKSCRKLVNK